MHEISLVGNLVKKIQTIAAEHSARKVTGLKVKLGAFSHISPEHLQEHFCRAARGTVAEGAQITIEILTDEKDSLSQDVLLENVTIER